VKPSEAPTVKAKRSPLILLVGLSAPFVRRCNEAAAKVQATVAAVEAGAESTFAMQTLPIAVMMHENAVPASPLATIARELGIELIPLVDEDLPDDTLEETIARAINAARERWRMSRS
jgi:hypothetical protein